MPRYSGGYGPCTRGMVIALRVGRQVVPSLPRALHIVRFLTQEETVTTGAAKEKRRWSRELRVSDICHPTPGARSPKGSKKLRAARIRTGVVWTKFDAIKTKSDNQLHYSSVSLLLKCMYHIYLSYGTCSRERPNSHNFVA
jgi:hypothetical protein